MIGDSVSVDVGPSVLIAKSAGTGTSEAPLSKQYGTESLNISQQGKAKALAEKHTRVRVVMPPYI